MNLCHPFCFDSHYPYSRLKPLSFQIGVICANWAFFRKAFP